MNLISLRVIFMLLSFDAKSLMANSLASGLGLQSSAVRVTPVRLSIAPVLWYALQITHFRPTISNVWKRIHDWGEESYLKKLIME
jgi:hypothetical protein